MSDGLYTIFPIIQPKAVAQIQVLLFTGHTNISSSLRQVLYLSPFPTPSPLLTTIPNFYTQSTTITIRMNLRLRILLHTRVMSHDIPGDRLGHPDVAPSIHPGESSARQNSGTAFGNWDMKLIQPLQFKSGVPFQ